MTGAAEGGVEVEVAAAAEEEEEEVKRSLVKGENIAVSAVSLCMACLAAVALASELGPGMAVLCAGLASAASFGWSALLDDTDAEQEGDDYY